MQTIRIGLGIVLFSFLAASGAQAAGFVVPYGHPALTIAVPGNWSPNQSDDGVDAAAPDNALFFSIYTAAAKDAAAVQRDSLAILGRNGMKIETRAKSEGAASFAGLTWIESQYSATEDGKPEQVKLEVSKLPGNSFIQLIVWGSPAGTEKNAASLANILKTIKLKGR